MLYPRKIFKQAEKWLFKDEFIIFTGARQTGKTSILIMVKNFLEEKGKSSFYFNLENPEYLQLLNKHPYNIFELMPKSKSRQTAIIDEIQYLDNPTNFLKLLYDEKRSKIKVIASGSSSFYIDKKFKDSLVGRKILFEVYSLDFNEFLIFSAKGGSAPGGNIQEDLLKQKNKKLSVYYKNKLKELWNRYLIYGGYPKVVLAEDNDSQRIILEDIVSSYIKKDISDAGIKNTDKYFALLKILASQTGELVNTQELANTLNIAHKTIEEYLYVMKKSYQVAFIKPFYKNARKELTKMPKVYFYDLGLRNFLLSNFDLINKRTDKGAYLENIVFKEFLKQTQDINFINFWRTQDKKEVDFIVEGKNAFEIKFDGVKIKEKKYSQFKSFYPEMEFNFLNYSEILEKFYQWKI
ncbi:MAG: ATP-binding protein [Candidatus Kuenenbacteria bacterium]